MMGAGPSGAPPGDHFTTEVSHFLAFAVDPRNQRTNSLVFTGTGVQTGTMKGLRVAIELLVKKVR